MPYSAEQIEELDMNFVTAGSDLLELYGNTVQFGQALGSEKAKEHLLQGVARRLFVLRRCLIKVFELFPVSATAPIGSDQLYEVQIYLHAFVINLYGIFDNYAWSFIHHHGLEADFDDPRKVGLFKNRVQRYLPDEIRNYVQAQGIRDWHRDYLTNYRDALAHRIPLYVPPSVLNPDQEARFRALEGEINIASQARDWDRRDMLFAEQSQVGTPCFSFVHSFSGTGKVRDVLLHPQMLCDSMTVVAFGNLYRAHCNNRAVTPSGANPP
jgi:hypothetical protein